MKNDSMKESFQSQRHCGDRRKSKKVEREKRFQADDVRSNLRWLNTATEQGQRTHHTEKSVSRVRRREIDGAIIHISTSHDSANEEECDSRGSTNRSKCNQTAELDESRRFDLEACGQRNRKRSKIRGIVRKMNSISKNALR